MPTGAFKFAVRETASLGIMGAPVGINGLTCVNKTQSAQDWLIKHIYGSCSSIYKRHRLLIFKEVFYYFVSTEIHREINEPVLKYFSERLEGFSVNHDNSTRFRISNRILPPLIYGSICHNVKILKFFYLSGCCSLELHSNWYKKLNKLCDFQIKIVSLFTR